MNIRELSGIMIILSWWSLGYSLNGIFKIYAFHNIEMLPAHPPPRLLLNIKLQFNINAKV